MRVWILALTLIGLVGVRMALGVEPLSHFQADNRVMKEVFRDVCKLSKYKCSGIKAPVVRRSSQLYRMKLNGLYMGGKIIWIADELMPMRARLTMFHETVHYLQVQVGGIDPRMVNRYGICTVEREALELTNRYAQLRGMPKAYVRTLEEWKRLYGC